MIKEASDYDSVEEHGDHVAFVVKKLPCNQKFPDTTKTTSNLLFKVFGQ